MLEEILNAIKAGKSLSPEQTETLTNAFKSMASGGKSLYGMSAEDQKSLLQTADQYKNTPTMKAYFNTMASGKNADRFTQRYKPFFNSLLQGADIATSLSQISKSNAASRALVKPGIPQAPGIDPALNAEIGKAQQGTFDTSRAIAPAVQGINDQYQKDLNIAKSASGGQTGTYASLAQQASLSRMRGMGQLPAVSDQVRRGQQARLDNLIGMRQGAVNNQYQNQLQGTQMAQNQYNQDALAAGNLGAMGRSNLRNVFQTLPDNLLGSAGRLMPVSNPYDQATTPNTNVGTSASPWDAYHQQVTQSLADNMRRNQSKYLSYRSH